MLEIWHALTALDFMDSGMTKPLAIICECEDGETALIGQRERFVVKSLGHPRVTESSLFREALGNLLARYLAVPTPKPVIVRMSPGFINATRKITDKHNIRLLPGSSLGAQYFAKGYLPFTPGIRLGNETLQQAAYIYAYDLLVANGDRLRNNPNCAMFEQNLLAYDFGYAFSFVGTPVTPWTVNELTGLGAKHLFYPDLRGQAIDWSMFTERLGTLKADILQDMTKTFPNEWLTIQTLVFDYLLEASENPEKFEKVIRDSLQ